MKSDSTEYVELWHGGRWQWWQVGEGEEREGLRPWLPGWKSLGLGPDSENVSPDLLITW